MSNAGKPPLSHIVENTGAIPWCKKVVYRPHGDMSFMPQVKGSEFKSRLFSTAEAALYLGVSRSTINRMCVGAELPVIRTLKHWRIDRVDLDAWIEREKELL